VTQIHQIKEIIRLLKFDLILMVGLDNSGCICTLGFGHPEAANDAAMRAGFRDMACAYLKFILAAGMNGKTPRELIDTYPVEATDARTVMKTIADIQDAFLTAKLSQYGRGVR
jgi:hypothetical protein